MIEYSVSRKEFNKYILVKNFLQFSLCTIAFWLLGYGFSISYDNKFIGNKYFAGDDWLENSNSSHGILFSYILLLGIFVVYIINLALVEKVSYITYIVYPIILLSWIWPVVFAWGIGGGWLYDVVDGPFLDYGFSVTVFTFAGAFGLVGAILSGRRKKRFKHPENFKIVNTEIYVLGAFLTILGVLGIVSFLTTSYNGYISFANLWVCGAVSSVFGMKILTISDKEVNMHFIASYQGFIAGMVFIASSAYNTEVWISGLHGLLSGFVFAIGMKVVNAIKIDDPANVTATFLIPGIFGGILPAFIDKDYGLYFGEDGKALGTSIVGTIVILGWSLFWAFIVFGILKLLKLLRNEFRKGFENTEITQRGFREKGAVRSGAENEVIGENS